MQIRVANRQDEPIIKTIIANVKTELGQPELDLTGSDADLMNIESHYFWYDGLFLVAEDDGTIVGLAGAHKGDSDDVLELVRLVVVPARRHSGIAAQLLSVVEFFAANAQYGKIAFYPAKLNVKDMSPYADFHKDEGNDHRWIKSVKPSQIGRGSACSTST